MRFISLIILSCLSMLTHAVVVSDLYQVQVEVADQSQSNRTTAFSLALEKVILKVSGNANSLQSPVIQQNLAHPDSFVQSYSYVENKTTEQLEIDVHFGANLIDDLLRQAEQPIWGRSRPLVLVWQAVEENNDRFVINEDHANWQHAIEDAMNDRGIPTLWPTLDLEDQIALPVANLWGLFRSDIASASERYLTDAYLAGRLTQHSANHWQYTGYFNSVQAPLTISAKGDSKEAVLAKVADQVATFLADLYAVKSSNESSGQQLSITNVNDFQEYQNLLRYLQNNSVIKEVILLGVNQNVLNIELVLSSSWDQAWSTLALDQRLLITDQPQTYQWQP